MDALRFATVAALVGCSSIVAGQSPDASALRDHLDAYLTAYEPRLSELVAEETLKQRELRARNVVTLNPRPEGERTLVSEVFLFSRCGTP